MHLKTNGRSALLRDSRGRHPSGGRYGYAVQRAHRVDALTLEGKVVPVRDAVVSAARGYQLEDVEPDLVAYCLVQRSLANGRQVGLCATLDTPQRSDQAWPMD